ncbi:hypothetical protein [Streptomyces sp. NPDC006267]|uniref:hypothetical protein n=1 Tax=Streptomyces sp. NPDC006267 TaxID=3157173 RepID=UPI0033A72B73
MSTTYTVKCVRCGGTGVYDGMTAAGRGGECFGCNGTGRKTVTRYTAEEKATLRARKLRFDRALELVQRRSKALAATAGSVDLEDAAFYGFLALRDGEPDRFLKMLDALDAGRLDDVIHCLAKYRRS